MQLARKIICVVAILTFGEMMLENAGSEPIDFWGTIAMVREFILLLCILGLELILWRRDIQAAQSA